MLYKSHKFPAYLFTDREDVLWSAEAFWTSLFAQHFVDSPDDASKDDMLFYVRKNRSKSKFRIPQVAIASGSNGIR